MARYTSDVTDILGFFTSFKHNLHSNRIINSSMHLKCHFILTCLEFKNALHHFQVNFTHIYTPEATL
jgi:hypothetical protein